MLAERMARMNAGKKVSYEELLQTAEAELLRDCDERASERFVMLDAMETEDGSTCPNVKSGASTGVNRESATMPDTHRLPGR